jgi:hypothetical protein
MPITPMRAVVSALFILPMLRNPFMWQIATTRETYLTLVSCASEVSEQPYDDTGREYDRN